MCYLEWTYSQHVVASRDAGRSEERCRMADSESERGSVGLVALARSSARRSQRVCQTRGVVHAAVQDVRGEVSISDARPARHEDFLAKSSQSCQEKGSQSLFLSLSAYRGCAAPDSSDDPLRTSTILPVTPPVPSNSCACLASVRGNRRAIRGVILRC